MPIPINFSTLLIIFSISQIVLFGLGLILLLLLLRRPHYEEALAQIARDNLLTHERLQQLNEQRHQIQQLLIREQAMQVEQRERFDQHQINSLKLIQDSLRQATHETRQQVSTSLNEHAQHLGQHFQQLLTTTEQRLNSISQQVDQQLAVGFEKTTATFVDIVQRLTMIDEAQKKITELSSNVVSLQEVLTDKRSRGVFGEVQLHALIKNVLPTSHYSLQHTLSNHKCVDCLLLLPEPNGNIAIDAKFPLESYQLMTNIDLAPEQRHTAQQQFRRDIKHHIDTIADKYIIPNETADGAILFIPAEAIFAEIHSHFPDLVERAFQSRVWLVSPTTMMAVLTTARAVLKDAATRQQVHIIQQHLIALSKDFARFEQRMQKLATHIEQAHQDVSQVQQSSKKITSRFTKIEKVELTTLADIEE